MAETSNASTVGEHLRRAREAKGLSLAGIAERTKIHLRVLEALEEDRAHEHLSPVYVHSFLKAYATLLGEDFPALSRQYGLTATRSATPSVVRAPVPRTPPPLPLFHQPVWMKRLTAAQWMGLGVALLAVLFFAGTRVLPAPTVVRAPTPPTQRASAPAAKPAKSLVRKHEPLQLIMHVRERVWVQVKADGEIVFQQVLGQGAQERWSATKDFELWLGNAGAVRLELNGHDLGSPGKPGEVVRGVTVTREGLVR